MFEQPKIEYSIRSINSLIKAIIVCRNKYPVIKIKTIIVDDQSKKDNLDKIRKLIQDQNIEIIPLDHEKYKSIIKKQEKTETFSNLASLLQSFEIGKNQSNDLIFFIEDDYIHSETMLDEMISSYERIASQVKKDIIMCPADYPYLYMEPENTNLIIGEKRHWRKIDQTLCSFVMSKKIIEKYYDDLISMCKYEHYPFEKPLHKIYNKELCISPIPSLSVHFTNINSIYGLSPNVDWKKLWEENES